MTNYKQIQINKKISIKNRKKLNKQILNAIFIFLIVSLFISANVYNNRWGRNITKLDTKIKIMENTLEKERKTHQVYESKAVDAKKNKNSLNMHYSNSNVVVVQEFPK